MAAEIGSSRVRSNAFGRSCARSTSLICNEFTKIKYFYAILGRVMWCILQMNISPGDRSSEPSMIFGIGECRLFSCDSDIENSEVASGYARIARDGSLKPASTRALGVGSASVPGLAVRGGAHGAKRRVRTLRQIAPEVTAASTSKYGAAEGSTAQRPTRA